MQWSNPRGDSDFVWYIEKHFATNNSKKWVECLQTKMINIVSYSVSWRVWREVNKEYGHCRSLSGDWQLGILKISLLRKNLRFFCSTTPAAHVTAGSKKHHDGIHWVCHTAPAATAWVHCSSCCHCRLHHVWCWPMLCLVLYTGSILF